MTAQNMDTANVLPAHETTGTFLNFTCSFVQLYSDNLCVSAAVFITGAGLILWIKEQTRSG